MSRRFNRLAFIVLAAFSAISFAACGGSKNQVGGAQGADAFQADGKSCGEKVVKEWNELYKESQLAQSVDEAKVVRAKYEAFGKKWENLVCNVQDGNGKPKSVNVNDAVKERLAGIDEAIAHVGNGGPRPGMNAQ